jgi:hypothetical protein
MFKFILKYFGFLKSVPLMPLLFDSMQKVFLMVNGSPVPGLLDSMEDEISRWPGIKIGLHRYGGLQFNIGRKEFGHIHSNGLLDIRFSKIGKQELLLEGKVSHHHVFPSSGWISFRVQTSEDTSYALTLLKSSYLQLCEKERNQQKTFSTTHS